MARVALGADRGQVGLAVGAAALGSPLTSVAWLANTLGSLSYLANKQDLNDGDIRDFLAGYKMPHPVASDAGALASVTMATETTAIDVPTITRM